METPGATTIEGLAEFLGVDAAATAKAMPVVAEGEVVLALVRGDDRLHELKTAEGAAAEFRPATPDEIRDDVRRRSRVDRAGRRRRCG